MLVPSAALPTCRYRQPGSAPAQGIAPVSHPHGRKSRGEARGRPLTEPTLLFRRHGSLQRRRLLDQGPHLGRHHQKRGVQNQRSGGGAAPARAPTHHRYAALPGAPCREGLLRGSLPRATAAADTRSPQGSCLEAVSQPSH